MCYTNPGPPFHCIPCLILEPGRHPKSCNLHSCRCWGLPEIPPISSTSPVGLYKWSVLLGYWTSPLGMWGSWRFRAMRTKAAKHDRLTWTVSTWSATWNSAYICVHKFPWIVILRMSWRSGPRGVPQCLASIFQSKMSYSRMVSRLCRERTCWFCCFYGRSRTLLWTVFWATASKITRRLSSALATSTIWLFHSAGTTVVLKHGFSCLSFSMKAFSLTKNKLKQSSWPPCLLPPISKHIRKLALNFNVAEIKELCHHLNI